MILISPRGVAHLPEQCNHHPEQSHRAAGWGWISTPPPGLRESDCPTHPPLCWRDGCTGVRRVGGANDNGADVVGRLPDGRTMVIQCKRYAPTRTIASREMRDLVGAKAHFGADLAVFVTTAWFSRPSEGFAVQHGIHAVHRDHLWLWNSGASLLSLGEVTGGGQGDSRHWTRWRQAYGE
ncbi:restriction endonuclease [Streptomyces nigrescens]